MKPFISIALNRIYRLRLTFGVILEYEQLTETPLRELKWSDAESMIALLWLMMRRENPDLMLEQAAAIAASAKDQSEIFRLIRQAVLAAFTDRKSESAKEETGFFDFTDTIKMAAEMGVPQHELWELTPAELTEIGYAFGRNLRRAHNDRITQAWYEVYFQLLLHNNKKMPDLSEYKVELEPKPKRDMSDDEMQRACELICAAFGGKVVEI